MFSVALGDLDGDGKLDVAVAALGPADGAFSGGDLSVLRNAGDGTFPSRQTVTGFVRPWSVALGDVNLDGRLDVAVANSASDFVSVLLGAGGGALRPPIGYGTGPEPIFVSAADLDGDGKLDLAVADNLRDVAILRSRLP